MRKLLCITQPSTHPSFDTTVALYQAWAQHQAIELYHANAEGAVSEGSVRACAITDSISYEDFLNLESSLAQEFPVSHFDLVFLRTDKPYPAGLLETCSTWEDDISFVNLASATLNIETRIFLHQIAKDFIPPSILTRDKAEALQFARDRERFIVKKNRSYGGKGVYLIEQQHDTYRLRNVLLNDTTFSTAEAALDFVWELSDEPFEVCAYLAKASEGDKRILVVEDEIYGAYIRRSSGNTWVNNISAGGYAELCEVLPHEEAIIRATAPEYVSRGMRTLGYDFLQNDEGIWTLTEINAGNIGGYNRLEDLGRAGTIDRLIDWMLTIPLIST